MALTEPDVELIIGMAGALVTYLTTRQVRARRTAKQKMALEVRELIDSYKEQVTYLRDELARERRRRRNPDD